VIDPEERDRVLERLSHGAPTFFVREKRAYLMVLTDHHGDGRLRAAGEGI
jgi:hypothetical protein